MFDFTTDILKRVSNEKDSSKFKQIQIILLVELLLNCRLQVAEVNLQRLNRLFRQLLLVLQLLIQPLIFLLFGEKFILGKRTKIFSPFG